MMKVIAVQDDTFNIMVHYLAHFFYLSKSDKPSIIIIIISRLYLY